MHRGLGGAAAFDRGTARPLLSQIVDVLGQPIDIDDMRVEVFGEPFLELAVALVARVCDSLKQLAIAPRTTDVLGWTVALGLDQAGIKHARFGIDQAFNLDPCNK